MRAMKRTVSVVLALVMVLGMMTMAISVSAAETNQITATSNFADSYSVDYNANANQVTVTYTFKTALKVVNFEGTATYDSSVLQLSEATFPGFNGEATANTEEHENTIYVNASNTNGYDFTGDGVAIANLVFNIVGTGNTTVNFDINEMTATTAPGTVEANDVDVFEESAATGDQAYTATATVTTDVPAVEFSNFLYRYRTYLDGKVSLSYVFYKTPRGGYDPSTLSVRFTGPEMLADQNKTVAYTDMPANGASLYRYEYQMYSAMFSEPIKCEIIQNGNVISEDTYSIADYVKDNIGSANAQLSTLYKTLLDFGAKAQTQFDYNTDNLANKDIDYTMQTITSDDITLSEGEGVKPDLSALGLSFFSESGEYLAATDLKVIFRVTDKAKFAAAGNTVTVDGTEYELSNYNATGTLQILTIPSIASPLLDHAFEIKFSNGATYKTSIMAQVKSKLAANPSNEFYMAVYWYNQAANNYFGE